MIPTERFERVEIASATALRDWLAAHHGQAESVWLVRWLKGAGERSVPIDAILDELLCWGWVDGLGRKLDAGRTLRLASPRRSRRHAPAIAPTTIPVITGLVAGWAKPSFAMPLISSPARPR